jgi:pimeloyl-ACP methyl ester carboxylesterase
MARIWLDEETFTARSFDGTLLNAYRFGSGNDLPLLIVNGIGANLAAWRRVVIDIKDRIVVTWDHRGLHGSESPAS